MLFFVIYVLKFCGFLPLKSALSKAFKRLESSTTMFFDDLSQYKPSSLIPKDEKQMNKIRFFIIFFGHPG